MPRNPGPAPVLLASWLVPGGGHFLMGKRAQGTVFFLAVTFAYVLGMYLADFTNVSPDRHPFYFAAHILNGAETIIATILTKSLVEDHVARHFGIATFEIGTLYTAAAAILNVIVMMDAWGRSVGIRSAVEEGK